MQIFGWLVFINLSLMCYGVYAGIRAFHSNENLNHEIMYRVLGCSLIVSAFLLYLKNFEIICQGAWTFGVYMMHIAAFIGPILLVFSYLLNREA